MARGTPFPKGKPRAQGAGRAKGTVNKSTMLAREAIGMFVDNNAHRLEGWLDKVAEKDPEKAFSLFQSVIEYHVPKLARTENKTDMNANHTINWPLPKTGLDA